MPTTVTLRQSHDGTTYELPGDERVIAGDRGGPNATPGVDGAADARLDTLPVGSIVYVNADDGESAYWRAEVTARSGAPVAPADARISLDNGVSTRLVRGLYDAEVAMAIRHAEVGDDELREAAHAAAANERDFVARYAALHEQRFGTVWALP